MVQFRNRFIAHYAGGQAINDLLNHTIQVRRERTDNRTDEIQTAETTRLG